MSERIDELYDAAQKATPGPFHTDPENYPGAVFDRNESIHLEFEDGDTGAAAFYALAEPQTVMALVEVYRAAKADNHRRDDTGGVTSCVCGRDWLCPVAAAIEKIEALG